MENNKPDPAMDTSRPGREEEVIDNTEAAKTEEPIKDELTKDSNNPPTAEKTFEEGLQNNNDTSSPLST